MSAGTGTGTGARCGARHDAGTTIVELLVALAVMAIAMVMIASTLISAQRMTNRVENSSTAVDSARLASAMLDRELRSAVCISSPGENATSNTLTFQTLAGEGFEVLTYVVGDGALTRATNLGQAVTLVRGVGATTTAFRQVTTPLRTIVVDIPIRSDNGGEFHLQTTVAGRNAWRSC
jgi:type II secretory pathway pseudopilin PulG